MATIGEKITGLALEQLGKQPDGVRYADLVRLIQGVDPSLKTNTIHGTVWDLATRLPEKVYKPSRGLFRLIEFRDKDTDQLKADLVRKPPKKTKEEDFYAPFADWLVNDLEECTRAIPLGGNRFRDKWGTPDVIGKRESKKSESCRPRQRLSRLRSKLMSLSLSLRLVKRARTASLATSPISLSLKILPRTRSLASIPCARCLDRPYPVRRVFRRRSKV